MRIIRISGVLALITTIALFSGCTDELKELKVQNNIQRNRINQLTSELKAKELQLDKMQRQLKSISGKTSVQTDVLKQKIAALQKDIADKKALINSMQSQLLYGGAQLPVELSTLLEDFAKEHEMITFDSNKGLLKFKSDLLFEPGSDQVSPQAVDSVKALCQILNTEEAEKFDIIIAGHTDDMRIAKAETLLKHPTNWHLSAHRAIAVLDLMARNNLQQERMSIRGFGQHRPLEPNKPDKKGNPKNRRVEIYIVPEGA